MGRDSLGGVDRFEEWQMGDAGYQERVQSASGLFVENSGMNSVIEKINEAPQPANAGTT